MSEDQVIYINLSNLTSEFSIRELRELVQITGKPLGKLFDGEFDEDLIQTLAYVKCKRDNPEFTMDDALDVRVKFAAPVDPTPASGEAT